jgi:hypothetical protein
MLDGTGGDGASSRLRLQGRYLVFGHYCHRGMSTSRTRVVAVVLTNFGNVQLTKGVAPLAHYPPMKVLLMTLQNPPPTLEGNYSRAFKEMVESCLQKDPTKRCAYQPTNQPPINQSITHVAYTRVACLPYHLQTNGCQADGAQILQTSRPTGIRRFISSVKPTTSVGACSKHQPRRRFGTTQTSHRWIGR